MLRTPPLSTSRPSSLLLPFAMGLATTVLGTMKFFRRKDKRKNDAASAGGRMPGFGSTSSNSSSTPGKHAGPTTHAGYGFGDARPDSHRPFGSPPRAGSYDPRSYDTQQSPGRFQSRPTRRSAEALAQFPAGVLERIFAFVCPHSRDESYATCEQSSVDDGCMLCDLRDLAHCVAVCRRWKEEAVKLLYHSIRIDSVHYCDLEAILADRRKRRSFFDRNGQPEDPAQARLKLLCRAVREDPVRRGRLVQYLKMPYMLRESCQADLARTIAVTPNLRYVDLPEGLFTDDPSFLTLRLEVQARCLELRKMTYMSGSENSLQALASGRVWTNLEVLELIRIEMEPTMLRHVLAYLGNLRALKVTQTASFSDETLAWNEMLPPFPPLEEFILTDVPNVTSEGLKGWLMLPEARQALRVLTLNSTGVRAWTLQELLGYVPGLKHLSIVDSVSSTITAGAGTHHIPPLVSTSLQSLHFEITAAPTAPKYSGATASYYNYLASSLLSGGLPHLRAVYVRDPNFPDLLLGLPPPAPAFAEGRVARPASSGAASPFSSPNNNRPSYYGGNGGSPMLPPSAPFATGASGHRPHGSLSSLNGAPFLSPNPNPRFSSNNPFAGAATTLSPTSSAPFLSPTIAAAGGAGTAQAGPGPGPGFLQLPAKLEIFTKSATDDDDQLGWSFVQIGGASSSAFSPPTSPRLGSSGGGGAHGGGERPLSSYGLGADVLGGSAAGWSSGGGARRSVLVGAAGGGGFLAVPGAGGAGGGNNGYGNGEGLRRGRGSSFASGGYGSGGGDGGADEWPRPRSSAGEKKREKMDLWR